MDTQSGLYYLQARYYDPSLGQFMTVDPLVKETGMPYSYTTGDPLNQVDPLGLNGSGCGWNPICYATAVANETISLNSGAISWADQHVVNPVVGVACMVGNFQLQVGANIATAIENPEAWIYDHRKEIETGVLAAGFVASITLTGGLGTVAVLGAYEGGFAGFALLTYGSVAGLASTSAPYFIGQQLYREVQQ